MNESGSAIGNSADARVETSRERLYRIVREIQAIADDDVISPTPYDDLYRAISALNDAARFALDAAEQDGMRASTGYVYRSGALEAEPA